MKIQRSPLRKAFDESRYIILAVVLIAVAYNVFAESRIDWIRHPPGTGDTTSLGELLGDTAAVATPIDTTVVEADTAAPADTSAAADSAALAAERARAIEDSARTAREARARDSAASAAQSNAGAHDEAGAKEIGTATARQIFDRNAAVWFDARTKEEFVEGHIPGAHNVYANDFQQHIGDILQMGLKSDQLIVVYCGGGLCELSHDLAKNMRLLGFTKVVVYTGGTGEWTKNNYPMTKGEQ